MTAKTSGWKPQLFKFTFWTANKAAFESNSKASPVLGTKISILMMVTATELCLLEHTVKRMGGLKMTNNGSLSLNRDSTWLQMIKTLKTKISIGLQKRKSLEPNLNKSVISRSYKWVLMETACLEQFHTNCTEIRIYTWKSAKNACSTFWRTRNSSRHL